MPTPLPDHCEASPWMKPEAAADYLGVALGTLRNWTSARFIPFSKRRGIVRYHRDQLDKWLMSKSCKGRSTFSNGVGDN